jgi:hypothetical protein
VLFRSKKEVVSDKKQTEEKKEETIKTKKRGRPKKAVS